MPNEPKYQYGLQAPNGEIAYTFRKSESAQDFIDHPREGLTVVRRVIGSWERVPINSEGKGSNA